MSIRQTKVYRFMDIYTACSIVEGFSGREHTEKEMEAAWQYLYDIKAYRWLQGWYGRTMQSLLEDGLIRK